MPIFAAIAAFLARFAGVAFLQVLITRVLVVLGVGAVTYAGVSTLVDAVVDHVATNLSTLPQSVVSILHIAKVDKAISLVLSAVTARAVLSGLTAGGAVKRMVWRGPGT